MGTAGKDKAKTTDRIYEKFGRGFFLTESSFLHIVVILG